jgi:predicted GNAT superfamily acetyltransferase
MSETITIRRAETPEDYRACQEAQRRAWGITEDGYLVPVATMVGAQHHGGLVLGAFLPGGEAVGLSFAFLGRVGPRLGLYSQLTGVVPGYQGQRLGERLKHAQREYAHEQGLEVIAWAFDPLQAGNAHFNLARLGATVGRYIDDMYGPRTDALNAGVPTDRVIAEWDTDPAAARPRVDPAGALALPRLLTIRDGIPLPVPAGTALSEKHLLLEVPADIARLRSEAPSADEAWRRAVRDAFRLALAAGFRAVGFVREEGGSPRRCFYVLERP